MGSIGVDEITLTPLSRIAVYGGDVLHALKDTDIGFIDFGEAYFSVIEVGAIKAWKRHMIMTLNIVVPVGLILFVFVDDRGRYRYEYIGLKNYARLTIPPGIWFGFKGVGNVDSLLLNIADIKHDPAEVERKQLTEIFFDWESP